MNYAIIYEDTDAYSYEILKDGTIEITGYPGKETALVIPSDINDIPVTAIGKGAFKGHSEITTVIIPNSVAVIGKEAFSNCRGLTLVRIPDTISSIGQGTLEKCTSLRNIRIPDSVAFIGQEAFAGCESMEYITIPASVTTIWDNAFTGCEFICLEVSSDSYAEKFAIANDLYYYNID